MPIAISFTIGDGDEEAQRHADRHARSHEADERRHGGAGAERRDDAEAGGHDVAEPLALAAEERTRALDAHVGPQNGDQEDDEDEQQRDLHGVVEEEVDRLGHARGRVEPEGAVEQPVPQVLVELEQRQPDQGGGGEGQASSAPGGGRRGRARGRPSGHHPAVGRAETIRSCASAARV